MKLERILNTMWLLQLRQGATARGMELGAGGLIMVTIPVFGETRLQGGIEAL